MKIRSQVGMVLNLDKCIGCHTCSVTCKNVWTSREGMEYAWFNNVESKPGTGFPTDWENRRSGRAAGSVKSTVSCSRAWVTVRCCWVKSSPTRICRVSKIITNRLTTTTRTCITRRKVSTSRLPVLAPDHRSAHGQNYQRSKLGRNSGRRVRKARQRPELREHAEGDVRPV